MYSTSTYNTEYGYGVQYNTLGNETSTYFTMDANATNIKCIDPYFAVIHSRVLKRIQNVLVPNLSS